MVSPGTTIAAGDQPAGPPAGQVAPGAPPRVIGELEWLVRHVEPGAGELRRAHAGAHRYGDRATTAAGRPVLALGEEARVAQGQVDAHHIQGRTRRRRILHGQVFVRRVRRFVRPRN